MVIKLPFLLMASNILIIMFLTPFFYLTKKKKRVFESFNEFLISYHINRIIIYGSMFVVINIKVTHVNKLVSRTISK